MLAFMSFVIYFVKLKTVSPDMFDKQREELMSLSDVINGIEKSVNTKKGDSY